MPSVGACGWRGRHRAMASRDNRAHCTNALRCGAGTVPRAKVIRRTSAHSKPRTTTVVPTRSCRAALRCFTMQALLAAAAWCHWPAHAQPAADAAPSTQSGDDSVDAPLRLTPSRELAPPPRGDAARGRSIVVRADRVQARPELDMVAEGHVEFRRAGTVIRADRITYDSARRPRQCERQRARQPRRQPLLGPRVAVAGAAVRGLSFSSRSSHWAAPVRAARHSASSSSTHRDRWR